MARIPKPNRKLMEKPKVGQMVWVTLDQMVCQKVWDGSQWQPVPKKYYLQVTEERVKDLEVIVDLALTSGYLNDENYKSCKRMEDLVEQIKKNK